VQFINSGHLIFNLLRPLNIGIFKLYGGPELNTLRQQQIEQN